MGKKSLTKSTTKKKAATKKKATTKKSGVKAAPKKKAASKAKAASKKAAPKKKTTAKKPTVKTLIKKDFGSWAPETLFTVAPDEDYLNNFTAPPRIDETDAAKAKKLKSLLVKKFDLSAPEKPAKAKKTAPKKTDAKKAAPKKKTTVAEKKTKPAPKKKTPPAKKKTVSIPELLKLKFEPWQPEKMVMAVADEEFQKGFSAPPAIDTKDAAEADRIKALVLKTFDLKVTDTFDPASAEAKTETVEKTKAEAEAKAKAEKEAAEKAKAEAEAVEKANAAKEAEEKAKAEKAKAEAKAMAKAEKEAAEKAKADAAAKQKAEKPPAPPVMPQVSEPTGPPMNNAVKILIAIVGGLFGLLIIASAMNTNNYYLRSADNAVEIWQGKFSPTGKN